MSTLISKTASKKRARCENCHALYRRNPQRPKQKFCCETCRKEFHRYGSSYGPLKTGLHKAIDKKYAALRKELIGEMSLIRLRDTHRESELKRLAVEVAELRAKMVTARGQFDDHTHEVFEYTDYGTTRLETGEPRKA